MNARTAPIAVAFNDPDEYIAEIGRDRDCIDRQILRVTVRRRYGEPFVTVSVVALPGRNTPRTRYSHRCESISRASAASGWISGVCGDD